MEELKSAGFAVLLNDGEGPDDATVGGVLTRRVTARSKSGSTGELLLQERRPWAPAEPLHSCTLAYDLRGPEEPGMWDLRRELQAA